MTDKIKSLDESRFTTMGLLMWDLKNKRPLSSVSEISAIGEQLDVAGFNYHANRWEEYHSEYPSQPMISTENGTFKSTRSIMQTNPERCHLAMTDKTSDSYMAGAEHWDTCDRTKYMSGVFIWTGFDYYGEPTPYAWPAISSQFGAMDLCGFPKDFYYYYKSWWDETVSTVHIASSWNLKSGDVTDIHIFSDCEEVELFRNGKSLGRRAIAKNGYAIFPDVKFEPGALLAQGYKGLIPICADIVKTAGAAARLLLKVDYRENDITILSASVTDADGNIVPDAENPITLSIENGILLGASNGNPSDHTSVVSLTRNAFCGLAQFIVKGGTEITAKSTGLSDASVTL